MTGSEPDLVALARATQALLGPGVSVGYGNARFGRVADLLPQERVSAADMAPRRQCEFAAGRAAVRMAANRAGAAPFAVLMGPDRAPIWPEGVAGSITHAGDACLAAISRGGHLASIGIDLELNAPLPPDVMDVICHDADRALNPAAIRDFGDRFDLLLFSAKEAAYKCQYPLTGTLIDFDALCVRVSAEDGRFMAQFTRPVAAIPAGATIAGAFAFCGDYLLTTASIAGADWQATTSVGAEHAHV